MTPAQLLGLTPLDPGRAAVVEMLPQLRRQLPLGQEVFRSRAIQGNTITHRADRGDTIYWIVASLGGVAALRACLAHGPDLITHNHWTPRQVVNWAIQPNGIDYLATAAREARANPNPLPAPAPRFRSLAALPRLHESIGNSGSQTQRNTAAPYRQELDALSVRFEQVRSVNAAQNEIDSFRDALADVYSRIQHHIDGEQVTEMDYHAVMVHLMAWYATLDGEPV